MSRAGEALEALLALMRRLRDPRDGCPWDRAQTPASIAPYTIEEAYELADAIDRDEPRAIRDELGDLLFQVVFQARLAEERGRFDFAAVADALAAKLVRRHPHVFSTAGAEGSNAALAQAWEARKAEERAAAGARAVLADVPLALPALARANRLGRRAARVGFDWPDAAQVRAKVAEELAEADAAVSDAARREEIGDLLFAVANWARHLHVDPEDALRQAAIKFERRFAHMEQAVAAGGGQLERLSASEWDAYWEAAKAALRGAEGLAEG